MQLLECVPNFSEGRNPEVIKAITDAIESVEGVKLLDVDPGKATHRTVVTFVGEPEKVVEAAFRGIARAAELIDMAKHQGEHPRMGATDVCPLVPVSGISLEEAAEWARLLGERVGRELGIPVYLYEAAASRPERRNLADIRAGEYEGLPEKLKNPVWQPDFGPATFNARAGATVIGARDFLIAYNVNLNTTSVRRANSVAFDIREKGRLLREGNSLTGKIMTDENGQSLRSPGLLKGVKAIGWFIEEYGIAQVSMNITNMRETPLHMAFEACADSATRRGMRVTGSELVGLVPLSALLDAGRYFLHKQRRSTGVSEQELIQIAVKSMGLDDLAPFEPNRRIIEYNIAATDPGASLKLINQTVRSFSEQTASESPAPGGGSVSAYVGALGTALATMVANLSAHKRGWDEHWLEFSDAAEKGQQLREALLKAVDEDTNAFNAIMAGFSLPKSTPEEKAARTQVIQDATRLAIEVPLKVMKLGVEAFPLIREMVERGNPNSVTDAGVGALCVRTCVHGAWLNVQVNTTSLHDKEWAHLALDTARDLAQQADQQQAEILDLVMAKIQG